MLLYVCTVLEVDKMEAGEGGESGVPHFWMQCMLHHEALHDVVWWAVPGFCALVFFFPHVFDGWTRWFFFFSMFDGLVYGDGSLWPIWWFYAFGGLRFGVDKWWLVSWCFFLFVFVWFVQSMFDGFWWSTCIHSHLFFNASLSSMFDFFIDKWFFRAVLVSHI